MSNLPDFPHRASDQMRRALAELQSFYGVAQASGPGVVDVRSTGAKGDGAADDTNAIQAAIAQAPDGGTVSFPFGNYRITRQVVVTGKRLTLLGQSGAKIIEGAPITGVGAAGAMLLISGQAASHSAIERLECVGSEALPTFSGAFDREHCFLRVEGATAVSARGLMVRNKTYGVVFTNTDDAMITDVVVDGFVTTVHAPGKNYNAAVRVMGGSRARIANVHSRETGTLVLVGGSASFGIVSDCTGVLLKDNGVYIEATGWSVSGVKIDQLSGNGGSGVKVRGIGNSVVGCTVSNAVGAGGIAVTGTGQNDATGFSGSGSIVLGNYVQHVERFGILLDQVAGNYPRDCVIANNTLSDCAQAGAPFYPIAIHGSGHRVTGNAISGSKGVGMGLVSGEPSRPAEGILVSDNQWRGSTARGLQLTTVRNCSIHGNSFSGITGPAIELRGAQSTNVVGNSGGLINWDPSAPSSGGQCFGNSATITGDVSHLDPVAGPSIHR